MLNVNLKSSNKSRATSHGFSLVELLIVVAVLGILAAVALPTFNNNSQKAKEAAAKENLRILREAVERYAIKNNDIAPGYLLNKTTFPPTAATVKMQLIPSNAKKYLMTLPKNPFNNLVSILVIGNAANFPAAPTGTYGWIYQPATKTVRLDWPGTDSEGKEYFSY